jgi:AcrR family transcriptional regulator
MVGERPKRKSNQSRRPTSVGRSELSTNVKNPILVRERRAALIRAAVEVFYAKGYHASRVADVAAAAGISQGTVYNYVSSKDDLLFMVCEDHLRGYEHILSASLATAKSPREKLSALLRGNVEAAFAYQKHYIIMLRELHHVPRDRRRPFMRLAAEQRQICEDILREAADVEGLKLDNSLLTANLTIFLPNMIVSRGWDLHGKVADEQVADFLFSFLLRGLGLQDKS